MKTKFIIGGRGTGKTTKLIREAVEKPWYSVIVAPDQMRANYIKSTLNKMYGNSKIVPVVTIRDIVTRSREADGLFTMPPKLYFDDLMTCIKFVINAPCEVAACVIDDDVEIIRPYAYYRRSDLFNPHIDHVIFNGPATIVFWKDGTKTVVKYDGKGRKDRKMAIMYAFMRKIYGEGRPYHDILNEIEEALK